MSTAVPRSAERPPSGPPRATAGDHPREAAAGQPAARRGSKPATQRYTQRPLRPGNRRSRRRPRFELAEPPRLPWLSIALFVATCASTFWVGVTHWQPMQPAYFAVQGAFTQTVVANWRTGVEYMLAVVGILLTHEMGHFVQTLRYRVPASFPLCIPVPFNPIGTMGAVINMDGTRADRKQIFDIGIAGPLAGLVVAFPVLWFGVKRLDLSGVPRPGEIEFYLPLAAQWMLDWAHPGAAWAQEQWVPMSQLNPLFMAGWVGMLITGLNMLPVSQLDGGHTIYALFLDRAHEISRYFISFAILYVVINLDEAVLWTPMLLLVLFLGIHHPKTANDNVELGPVRHAIGLASLAIPVLCFPLMGVR
jgi:hypothetical protein